MPFKVIQGRRFWYSSKAHIDFLLVINTNLPPILHNFRDIAFHGSKIAIGLFGYPSFCVSLPWRSKGFPWEIYLKFSVDVNGWPRYQMAQKKMLKISSGWVRCTSVTDRRQTEGRQHISNVNVSSLKTLLDVGLVNYYYLYFTCRPLRILMSLCVSACDYSLSNSKCIAKDVTYVTSLCIRYDTIRWSILTCA